MAIGSLAGRLAAQEGDRPRDPGGNAEVGAAQEPGRPAEEPAGTAAAQKERDQAADVEELPELYFKDKDGRLVPVPGIDLEQLRKLIELKNQMARGQKQPLYTLHAMRAAGQVRGREAEMRIDFEVGTRASGWVRVPLRLGECALAQAPDDATGRQILHFNGATGGYDWLVRAEGGDNQEERHKLSLVFLAPLETAAGETRLRFTVPRTNESELTLIVPDEQTLGTILGGRSSGEPRRAEGGAAKATEFRVHALDGQFTISWHGAQQPLVRASSELRVETLAKCRIDARDKVIYTDATLTVRSFGGPFEGFRVRLPPGAKLTKEDPQFDKIEPAAAGDVLTVRHEKTTEPVTVRLQTQRYLGDLRPNELAEVAGFEVLGAVRQWGYVAVQVEEGWQLQWSRLDRTVEEIAAGAAPEPLRVKDVAAVFEYSRQPVSLRVRVFRPEPRIRVEPVYDVQVSAERVDLQAALKYTIDRAAKFDLAVDMGDWEVDRIEPAELLDTRRLKLDERQPLSIPLKEPREGSFEIKIFAHRAKPREAATLSLAPPRPEAQGLSARLRVQAAANVSLAPRTEAMVGLVREASGAAAAEGEVLTYRIEGPLPLFVADAAPRARRATVQSLTAIQVDGRQANVVQRLAYRIEFEPLPELTLAAPSALAENKTLEVSINGQAVRGGPVAGAAATANGAAEAALPAKTGTVLWRYPVPPPFQLGAMELTAKFVVSGDAAAADQPVPIDVPLVQPAEGTLTASRLTVSGQPGTNVEIRGGGWKRAVDVAPPGTSREVHFEAEGPQAVARLLATQADGRANGATRVEKAWIQSFFSADRREDWLVLRVASRQREVTVELPAGAAGVHVDVDGRAVRVASGAKDVAVPLPAGDGSATHLLRIGYQMPQGARSWWGRHGVETAWIAGGPVAGRMYWQVSLPQDQHLVWSPAELTREFQWHWRGTHFEREPLMRPAELARWIEAPGEDGVPSAANQYVFSTLGELPRLEFASARRLWLVAGASAFAVGLSLLWMFAAWLRRPAAVLLVTAAFLSVGFMYPDPAVVLAQASLLGVACGLTGMALRRLLSPRTAETLRTAHASSSTVERPTMHSSGRLGATQTPNVSTVSGPVKVDVNVEARA
ncbi:MAG: hypothetical protein HYS13_01295 [Planctomycetia bacterium]|nr:hypothetical protein [Planctomycetia bacterium]